MILKKQDSYTGKHNDYQVTLTRALLYIVLLKIKQKVRSFSTGQGICHRIEKELYDMGYRHLDVHDMCTVHELIRTWDEFSGDIYFPIHNDKKLTAYEQFHKTRFKFNRFSKYGLARRRLLDHMIKECSKTTNKGS